MRTVSNNINFIFGMKSIESIVVLPISKYSNYFDAKLSYDCDSCFLTFGNDGVAKVWNWKTGQLVGKQDDSESFKIENIREKDVGLQPCIIQAFYVEETDTIVIVTVDRLIGFVKLNKDCFFQNEKKVSCSLAYLLLFRSKKKGEMSILKLFDC
jgi:U3 small nucleolar RNA-associated protein 13